MRLLAAIISMLKKVYKFKVWRGWDQQIDLAVRDFHRRFDVFPTDLQANSITYRKIDIAASKQKIFNDSGQTPQECHVVEIGGFVGDRYALDFFIDEKVADRCFALIFDDSSPEGLTDEERELSAAA